MPNVIGAEFTQPKGIHISHGDYLNNGQWYFSLDAIGDTDTIRNPTVKDYFMNYWHLPLERQLKIIRW